MEKIQVKDGEETDIRDIRVSRGKYEYEYEERSGRMGETYTFR